MAAMKPRTGDGPMEAEREPRGLIVLRIPLEGGGRLVVSVNDENVPVEQIYACETALRKWLSA